jgi:hypothetical protein
MAETLLSPSVVKLYGRLVIELRILRWYKPTWKAGFAGALAAAKKVGKNKKAQDVLDAIIKYMHGLKTVGEISGACVVAEELKEIIRADDIVSSDVVIEVIDKNPILVLPIGYYSDGNNKFLEKQLKRDAKLARIYSFSYEGAYYELPRPALFLVNGRGRHVKTTNKTWTSLETSGVAARSWDFARNDHDEHDIRYWTYDKGDFSIRMDVETGQFWQILLEEAMRRGTALTSGEQLRITSGEQLRVGGDMRRR